MYVGVWVCRSMWVYGYVSVCRCVGVLVCGFVWQCVYVCGYVDVCKCVLVSEREGFARCNQGLRVNWPVLAGCR